MLRKLFKKEAVDIENSLASMGMEFESLEQAEEYFFEKLDADKKRLAKLGDEFPQLELNYSSKSLQELERLYFTIFNDKRTKTSYDKNEFEELMTLYMREVFIKNEMAEWQVQENHFGPGKYQLGLLYGYGSWTNNHYAADLDRKKDNKGRDYLYRYFMDFIPEELEGKI